MIHQLSTGWSADVERGPDWLFVHLYPQPEGGEQPDLAGPLWELLQREFVHRLVIEMDSVNYLDSFFLGELVRLNKRLSSQGGLLRLCGLSPSAQEVMQISQLSKQFPIYANREQAVMGGYTPRKPR